MSSFPGYVSVGTTKEDGGPAQTIPAGEWTTLDFGFVKLPKKTDIKNGQVYFEGVSTTIHKMSIRVLRGNGNPTAQHDFLVQGPVWAISYMALEYIGSTDDAMRAIQVWSAKGCTAQTRLGKDMRPVVTDGAVT